MRERGSFRAPGRGLLGGSLAQGMGGFKANAILDTLRAAPIRWFAVVLDGELAVP